jgi:hypothetical protein
MEVRLKHVQKEAKYAKDGDSTSEDLPSYEQVWSCEVPESFRRLGAV